MRCLTFAVESIEFESARGRKRKFFFFLSFFPSCQKLYSAITLLYNKLVGRLSYENTSHTTVKGDEQSKFVYTKIDQKAYRGSTGRILPAVRHLGKWPMEYGRLLQTYSFAPPLSLPRVTSLPYNGNKRQGLGELFLECGPRSVRSDFVYRACSSAGRPQRTHRSLGTRP